MSLSINHLRGKRVMRCLSTAIVNDGIQPSTLRTLVRADTGGTFAHFNPAAFGFNRLFGLPRGPFATARATTSATLSPVTSTTGKSNASISRPSPMEFQG